MTEAPWLVRAEDRGGLDDAQLLHVILLASYFGHLNRMADAIGIDLDYQVKLEPPHAEPATPPYLRAPAPVEGEPFLDLAAIRPAAAEALGVWKTYALERDAPLTRRRRGVILAAVSAALAGTPAPAAEDDVDRALVAMADEVTLAPWALGAATVAALRPVLPEDASIFDALSTATAATTFVRLDVALVALGLPP